MAVQTVPKSINIDEVMTPWFVGVSKSAAATAFSSIPMPTVTGAVTPTDRIAPTLANWNSIAYGNEIFLAVSSSTGVTGASPLAASSIDGITWANRIMPVSASWGAVAFGNGKFVVVADNSTTALTTNNGFTWNVQTLERNGKYVSLQYGGGQFIALGWNSSTAQVSTDGSLWEYREMPAVRNWSSLAYDSCLGRWVAVASNSNKGAYSNDGSVWVEMTMTKDTSWNSVASNKKGRYVAVTNSVDTSAAYSNDGINWINTNTLGNAFRWKSVCYGENYDPLYQARWVAVSHSTRLASSDDGISWTQTGATTAKEFTQIIPAYIPWRTNDTLTINNNAIVTVNTDQKKFWSAMTINNGTLSVVNDSSTVAIRFITGRTSGAAAQAITPTTGQGKIEVIGNWIDLSVGTGFANQEITIPYTDFVSALWVETAQDSSVFEIWLNVTGAYGNTIPKFIEGLSAVSTGQRGKFFIQKPNTIQDNIISFTNVSTNIASRIVTLPTTENINTGSQIIAKGNIAIPTASVVEKIIDGSTLEINLICTVGSSSVDVSIYNPYSQQLTNTIVFGNNINGNVVPAGARIRIPNIMITSDIPTNLQTASVALNNSFVMTNGGIINLDTCLFDEAYPNLTQSQSVDIKDIGLWNPPVLTECYDVNVDGYGISLGPIRRFHGTTGWIMRDTRDTYTSIFVTGTYLNNATFNNLVGVENTMGMTAGTATGPVGMLNIGLSSNVTGTNFRFYKLQNYIGSQHGIVFSAPVTNSTFSNIETYGFMPVFLVNSLDNTFSNLTYSDGMFNMISGYVAGQRIAIDPETDNEIVDNTPYYVKVRNFFTRDRSVYVDSSEFSSTPFVGAQKFPDYFTCYCNASKSVLMAWPLRYPIATTPAYEIYRGTSPGFTRDASSKVFSTNTIATVGWSNTLTKPSLVPTATRNIRFDNAGHIDASGTAPGNFITDGYLVGDKLIVTWTTATGVTAWPQNCGNYTITDVSTLRLTVAEPTIWEPAAYAATSGVTLTAVHALNKQPIVASPAKRLTFNVAKTITVINSPATGDLLLKDGYLAGDVISITGCTSPVNNGFKTISTCTSTVITVLEPLVTESYYEASANIVGHPIEDNTTYYYVFRKYDSSIGGYLSYSDSPEQAVYVHDPNQISTNRLLQNDVFGNASWLKSNCAVTTDLVVSPTLAPNVTTGNAELILPTAPEAIVYQRFNTAIDASYTFSVFLANMEYDKLKTTRGRIQLGANPSIGSTCASTYFVVDSSFQRISTTFVANASSLFASIIIYDVSGRLLASSAMANRGEIADPPLPTTTLILTNNNSTRYPILMRPWCRSYGGELHNSGIEVQYAAAPSGTVWTEVYCSSTRGFIPSITNRAINLAGGINVSIVALYNGSSRNVISDISQVNKVFNATYGAYFSTASSNNKIKNTNIHLAYAALTNLIYPTLMSNDNLIHNWGVDGYRNYISIAPVNNSTTANTSAGLTIQNVRINNSDNPISSQVLNTIIKGMTGANATPTTNALTYQLGSAVDGIAVASIAVYDSIFNELYFDGSNGALHVLFNASLKDPKPYTMFGTTSQFSNTGKLFLQNPSDAIIYTWPHRIYGVSGFRAVRRTYLQDGSISGILDTYKINGLDLGTTNDLLEGLKVEYDIDKGPGYTGFRRCNSTNMLAETLSSSEGFNLKIKLDAVKFMKYGTKTNSFVIGETIKGVTSLATATVNEVYEVSTGSLVGTIWISDVSGTFIASELIRGAGGAATRASNVATNTFPLGPSFTSYVDGLQLYTYIDTSVLYPSETITLQMTVKDENNLPISGAYAFIDDASVSSPFIMNTTTNASGIASVSYSGGASAGSKWRVRKYGYKPYSQTVDIGSINIVLPVTLVVDPQQT